MAEPSKTFEAPTPEQGEKHDHYLARVVAHLAEWANSPLPNLAPTEPREERLGWHMPDNLRWLAMQSERPARVPCGMLTGAFLLQFAASYESLSFERMGLREKLSYRSAVVDEAEFLLNRLDQLDWSQNKAGLCRDYHGHVSPSMARLRTILDAERAHQ